MPSGGSAEPPETASITLFIDRNSGGRTFRSLLTKAGIQVVLHDEQFPNKTADEDWLKVIGRLGWFIITGDVAVRRAPLFVQSLADSTAHVFVLLELNGASTEGKARCILSHLPRMRELAAANEPPALWCLGKGGSVQRFDHEAVLERMKKHRRLPSGGPAAGSE